VAEPTGKQRPKALISWSGGKDSLLCLHKVLAQQTYDVAWLLTTVSEGSGRIATHEVRGELLERQAGSLGIPLVKMVMPETPESGDYERILLQILAELKTQGLEVCIFGDLFLADIRAYREKLLAGTGLKAVFPLWDLPTDQLAREFIDLGFKARLVCINEQYLDRSFAGRAFDDALLHDLPGNVDPCGENGEFHSFVADGPLFSAPVDFALGEIDYRVRAHPGLTDESGYWTCDLVPAPLHAQEAR
jgi:uncharacterized protein (TIGR00290 family)